MSSFLNDYKEKSIERHSLIEEEEEKENKINILQNESYSEKDSEDELERSIISLDVVMPKNANKNLLKDTDAKKKASKNVNKISLKNKTGVIENISSERIIGLEENIEERKSRRIERIEEEWKEIFDSCKNEDTFFDDENNYQRLVSLRSECKTVLRWTHLFCFGNAAKQREKARVRKILGGVDRIMPEATHVRKMSTNNERKSGVGQFFKNLATKSWSGLKSLGREIFGPITSISVREFSEEKGIKSKLKGLLTVPGRFLGTLIFSYAWTAVINPIFFALNVAYQSVRPFLRVPVWFVDGIADYAKKNSAAKEYNKLQTYLGHETELFGVKGEKKETLSKKLDKLMFDKDEQKITKDLMKGRENEELEAVDEQIKEHFKYVVKNRQRVENDVEFGENADNLMELLMQSIRIKENSVKALSREELADENTKAYADRMNEITNVQKRFLAEFKGYTKLKPQVGTSYAKSSIENRYDETRKYGFKHAWKEGAAKKMKVRLPYYSFREWQCGWDRILFKGNLAGYGYNRLHKKAEPINEEIENRQIKYIVNERDGLDYTIDRYPEWINIVGWSKLIWNKISTFSSNIVSDYDDRSKIEKRMQMDMDGIFEEDEEVVGAGDEYYDAMEEAEELVNGNPVLV
ncbi:MAG: hypothetical protein K6A69_09700 [Lachnospiraceae bacterium]|nr:hypothetical protein [Lachnospiraceae bacterium]